MRILITGGAGFIGSHLCDRLIGQGHQVLCLDNFLTGDEGNVAQLRSYPNFELIRQDICLPYDGPEGAIDWVLHMASPASPPDYLKYPIQTLQVGSVGTGHALEIARAKSAIFLLASTSEIYGDPEEHPQKESYWGRVNPIGPRSVYDEAKRFSEALTMAYHREHKLDTRIVRIFNCYGPRMRKNDGRAVPNFILQALADEAITLYGDGSQTRSFCYIEDMVEGLLRLMERGSHDPINIGNDREISILELAKTIIDLTASKSRLVFRPLPADDPKVRCPDLSRAKKILSWNPTIPLEKGLLKTIEWFR